ncbi:MAG: sigma-70 family RNA polymerase sigma factor [Gammaproteobacteria bacterium]|nr:sigma-70 family RNA polymerase sigma factor [Gammaproteobacteria bacterium]
MAASEDSLRDTMHTLYSDHHGWLLGWLRRKLGCAHSAADLAHDTFVRLIAAPDAACRVADIREPRDYLATVAQRVMIDYFRRRTLERAYLEALALIPEAETGSPEQRSIIIETLCEIDAMLDGMGARPKQAFLMSQLEGLSYAEIARRLGVSVSSVNKYMARAVERCLLLRLGAGV